MLERIQGRWVDEDGKSILELGSNHTFSKGIMFRVRLSHPAKDCWSYCLLVIGSFMDRNRPSVVQWIVKESKNPRDG